MGLHFAHATGYVKLLDITQAHAERLTDWLLGQDDDTVLLLVAEDRGGDLVGMLALVAVPHLLTGERYADELLWWTEPSHRGFGRLGPALLDRAIEWAKAHELVLLKMIAPAGTEIGRWYLKHGFTEVETAYVVKLDHGPRE
jgi:GNAT superfamily N-acetyltransferase